MKSMLSETSLGAAALPADGTPQSARLAWRSNPIPGRNELSHGRDSVTGTILVPVSLSSGSAAALAIARRLAGESGARLVLLHVIQLNIAGEERGIPRTRLLNEMCQEAEIQLQQLAKSLGDTVAVETLVCEGSPARTIVETAKQIKADSVVMGTHGHRGWLSWLHRNTALKVSRQLACNVWLIAPAKRRATIGFARPRPSSVSRVLNPMASHERNNLFQAFVRVLFS